MLLAVSFLLAALPTPPQDAREPVQIASEGYSLALASGDELSGAVWRHNSNPYIQSDDVFLSVSDGTGLAWSAPLVVDQAPVGVGVSVPRVQVLEDRVLVAWHDRRHGAGTPFLRVYDGATGTLGPEVEIPTGSTTNLARVIGLALDAERVGTELRVHVALILHVDGVGGPAHDEVRLVTSTDAGASFLPALVLHLPSPLLEPYDPPLAVQAEAGVVHVMWLDPRAGDSQVFYQRSSDGGLTFDFAVDQQLTALPYVWSFRFDARGQTLAFATLQALSGEHSYLFADVSAAVSMDGGATFGLPQSVPLADPVTVQNFHPSIAVGSGGAVLLAWESGSPYTKLPNVFASRSSDGGATWSAEAQLSETLGESPELAVAGPGRERVVAAWHAEGYFPVGWFPSARLSADGGATWGAAFTLGPPMDGHPMRLAFNDRYQNLIALWNDKEEPNAIMAGGFRPQTLVPSGFTAGATQVGAAFERFDDGSPLAFLLVSTAPGNLSLPLGDLRSTGLGSTPLLLASVKLAAGPFAATLDGAGSGALAQIPATLPSPLTLYALGVSFDPAAPSFGDISDVVRIDL